jgi:UV DNA damage endonuclease
MGESNIYSENKPIQLGLCCLNIELRECCPTVFSSRSVILKTLLTKGVEHLQAKIIENLQDVLIMMDWNEANGIKVFRLSSELFPHISNPKAPKYNFDFAKELLKKIGEKSKLYNQRLTFHPGHFNCLGSPNENVIENTINDLNYHATILELMELSEDSVMVIHGGGIYGDKEKTIERWCKNYNNLPLHIKKRLVLENCERNFSIEDCLRVSEKVNVPIVFDTHHYDCYNIIHPYEVFDIPSNYIPKILETWKRRNIKPKFHVSEQGSGKCGHHSDYIQKIPEYLLEIPNKYKIHIDIMIEAKMKEKAIFKLYDIYPYLSCLKNI